MAIHKMSILAGIGTIPDNSGDVFFQPYSIVDTGTVLDSMVLTFNDSGAKDGVRGLFVIPQNYVDTAKLVIQWTANATTGTTIWDWSVLPRTAGEDMGAAAARTSETVTDTKTGTTFVLETIELTLTDGDYVAGDVVLFELFRDGVSDTMAAAALVFDVLFKYNDA